jgi:hypothetical protein
LLTLARQLLSLSLKGAFAKYRDDFFGRYFAPLGALMNGFTFWIWNVALVHEAPDDASGIGLFRPGYGCLSVLDS